MRPSLKPSLREYADAEARVRESLALRGLPGFANHTYPDRGRDLETMRAYHEEHGIPPASLGLRRRLWWAVKRMVRK